MALSWNEIKQRAVQFSNEWKDEFNEDAEAKSFMNDFFEVFGINRRRVATFEQKVNKDQHKQGYIDLLWKRQILIEFKSRGKNLDKAHEQAKSYFEGLKDDELPRYILVCDFARFRLYDLDNNSQIEFPLAELVNNVEHFGFIAGYEKRVYKEQDPVNIKAAELMGKLHDKLKAIGYEGHALELYLVRLLFILFADDTNIFERDIFIEFLEQKTAEDGSDLAARIAELFYILNSPKEKRLKNIDEHLDAFPYVNGKLFEEALPPASFDSDMRKTLIECCYLDWGKISPAIFGSMFQSVMNPVERRNLGAHYTSEKNILKLIKPLFLDELWAEFHTAKSNTKKLKEFHLKLSKLKFLDPACGCGNFLVITYRELRLLEMEILRQYRKYGEQVTDVSQIILLDVDMMYGIEYEEFPARIAEVAMWLMDHQMNMQISNEFGNYFARLPLKKAANIIHGNALQINWNSLIQKQNLELITHNATVTLNEPEVDYTTVNIKTQHLTIIDERPNGEKKIITASTYDYILGNPPFIGSKIMSQTQRDEVVKEFGNITGAGVLDYVTAWYVKAAKLIQNTQTKCAFVSTNSITQGEQVGILWNVLLNMYGIKIHFAHRTFKWSNEAKGNAAVYCVIVGFANYNTTNKYIFEYQDIKGEPHEVKAKNINPYLVDAKDVLITKRRKPICNVPEINFGNMPNDGGNFFIDDDLVKDYIQTESLSEKYIKPFIGAYEFLNGKKKWCLWFYKVLEPKDLSLMPKSYKRIEAVESLRAKSTRIATQKLADFPTLFGEIRQPEKDFILIPRVSSENRRIIPMGMFNPDNIVGDTCLSISNVTLYHLGILQSSMHMVWVNYVCGRLKSDYRYSNEIVYNNYPWPENVTDKQKLAIEEKAQKVLDVRADFPNSSLSDLYNPLTMPPALVKAHNELDKAVDLAYRPQAFESEAKRMEFLFELYEKYTAGLFVGEKKKSKKVR